MNRTLSEINAIIEAEVERRCVERIRGYSAELRTMADRMWHEEFGARPEQMTDGIEIVPPKSSFEQAQAEGRTISRAVVEVTLSPDSLKSLEDHIDRVADDMITTVSMAPVKGEQLAAIDAALKSSASEIAEAVRDIPVLQPADADASDAVPDGSPEWLAPVLDKLRPAKEKDIARRIAAEGGVTLQEVIYHFRPPIKETYATVILSNVRTALKRSGMALTRDADGVYRVVAEA